VFGFRIWGEGERAKKFCRRGGLFHEKAFKNNIVNSEKPGRKKGRDTGKGVSHL